MIQSKSDLRFYIREDKKRNLGAYKIGALKYVAYRIYGTDQMKAFRLLRALRRTEYAKNCLVKKGLFGKFIFALRHYHYHRLQERYDIAIGLNMVGYGFKLPHIVGGGLSSTAIQWVTIVEPMLVLWWATITRGTIVPLWVIMWDSLRAVK